MRVLLICCGLIPLISCIYSNLEPVEYLIGTWQIEGKNQYETWTKDGKNELIGHSYKIDENQKIIMETIAIKLVDHRMIYEATVPDQNEGQTIQFTLNPKVKTCFSFENLNHDFPKRIQYHKISDNEIEIRVTGDEGKGFSYKLIRQEK